MQRRGRTRPRGTLRLRSRKPEMHRMAIAAGSLPPVGHSGDAVAARRL